MLQEFSVKNFLSFKDKVTLSFEATKDRTFEDWQVVEVVPGVRLLRHAMIYGANASGKTNVLKALNFLSHFWFEKKDDINRATQTIPFLLDKETPKQPSEFEVKFYIGGTKFWYLLTIDNRKVLLETLYYYKSERRTEVFTRTLAQGQSIIKINSSVVKVSTSTLEELTLKCLPNMSFFAARNQVNCALPIIDEARDWMNSKFLPMIGPKTLMFNYAEKRMQKDEALTQYELDFINRADFNITGIETAMERVPLSKEMREAILTDSQAPEADKERLPEELYYHRLKTSFEHTVENERGKEKYTLPQNLQSEGTRRVIGIEAGVYEAIQNDKLLLIDEIESSLHPDLIEYVIENFFKQKGKSQCLMTTHYDPLLDTVDDLIRKDSVWFTHKGSDGHSSLYSMVEFKGLNKLRSLQKSYRNGLFRAVPNMKNLIDEDVWQEK